jgi:Na+/proline symporter
MSPRLAGLDAGGMENETRSARPYLWTLGIVWGLPALAVAVGYVVLPHELEGGGCEGIGFGCTLTPADTVLFLGVLASGPLLVAGLVAMVVIAVVQSRRTSAQESPVQRHAAEGPE